MLVFFIFSFALGGIPSAYVISKLFYGIDIRQHGSGNPGATNVWRVVGKKPAAMTFAFDVIKGLLPVIIAKSYFTGSSGTVPIICGFCAVAGHIWTPFLNFKGGKGVATGFGVFLGLAPVPVIFALAVFCVFLYATKLVAIGSIAAALSLPVFLYLFKMPAKIIAIALVLAAIVVWRHKSNIKNILSKKSD